jgi:hypothetical protein
MIFHASAKMPILRLARCASFAITLFESPGHSRLITRPFQPLPVSGAISQVPLAPFAPLRGAGVERTGLNVFAMTGCVLAVFVSGNHGQVFQHSTTENYFYCTSLAVIGSTIFCFKSAKPLPAPETLVTLPPTPQSCLKARVLPQHSRQRALALLWQIWSDVGLHFREREKAVESRERRGVRATDTRSMV